MTDNEKCAHDLAVALCLTCWQLPNEQVQAVIRNEENSPYTTYKSLYEQFLDGLNRDYPHRR